ncbi:MAG: antitoxin AF2212-like protein [Pirellulaceae bacterium]
MSETIEAVFDRGVFTPCVPVSIPNGQRVTITYSAPAAPGQPAIWPDLPPELVKNGDGTIVARGTRISLFLLLENHFDGTPWEKMQQDFPTVQPSDWNPIESFVRSNETALRPYSEKQQELARAYEAAAKPGPSLEELRQRFQKKFGAPFPQS